jgi:hypothetical protein
MGEHHYLQLTPHRVDAPTGEFCFRVKLPPGTDPDGLRVHWFGARSIGVRGGLQVREFADHDDEVLPGSRRSRPRLLNKGFELSGPVPKGLSTADAAEGWLEYRLTVTPGRKIAEEEEELQRLRDWATTIADDLPLSGWPGFWLLAGQGIESLTGATCWWAKQGHSAEDEDPRLVSPFPEADRAPYRNWSPIGTPGDEKDAEQTRLYGLTADERSFEDRGEWIGWVRVFLPDLNPAAAKAPGAPPESGKACVDVFSVGTLPRPASWALRTLERYLLECSRLLVPRQQDGGRSLSPPERARGSALEQALFDARIALSRGDWLGSEAAGGQLRPLLGFVLDNFPLAVAFLVLSDDGGYEYAFDWDQRGLAERILKPGPFVEGLRAAARPLVPNAQIKQVVETGLSCHWAIEPDLPDRPAFEELFCEGEPGDTLLLVPIHGATLGVSGVGVPLVAQVAWPRSEIPLVPELRAGLARAILDQAPALRNALLIHQFNREYGRFEFVRGLSGFLGHNLPKTAVTPLLTLATRIERAGPADLPALAARLRSFAYLIDAQLKALDAFRLPNASAIETALLDLPAILADLKLVFDALVGERAFQQERFEAVQSAATLVIDAPEVFPVLRGFRPAAFHTLFVPIDNTLKALTPERLAADPSCGRVRVAMEEESGALVVRIEDRAGGIEPDQLDAVRFRLQRVAAAAREGRGLSLDQHGGPRSGARLGLGLPLATYFLALLIGTNGKRGSLSIESVRGEGTTVTLRFPINPEQLALQL